MRRVVTEYYIHYERNGKKDRKHNLPIRMSGLFCVDFQPSKILPTYISTHWGACKSWRNTQSQNFTFPDFIRCDGHQIWIKDGRLHRDVKDKNGNLLPAVIYKDRYKEWWIDGERIK